MNIYVYHNTTRLTYYTIGKNIDYLHVKSRNAPLIQHTSTKTTHSYKNVAIPSSLIFFAKNSIKGIEYLDNMIDIYKDFVTKKERNICGGKIIKMTLTW